MLTGRQIREARTLLGWSRATLSVNAFLPLSLTTAVESSDGEAWLAEDQEAAIRRACEGSGIRFDTDADGQPTAVLARTVT